MRSLESYEATINAYSSIIIPRDDGSITVTALAPVGTIVIAGVTLTAAAGTRVTGANPTFDSSQGSTSLLATSIQDAINDPANPFLAKGVHAKAFSAAVGLRQSDPTVALGGACTNITLAQATLGDFAAGDLKRVVTPTHTETFAAQVIRWCRAGQIAKRYWNYSDAIDNLIDPEFDLECTEDDALVLFDEMDAQAVFYLGAGKTFADLSIGPTYPSTPGTQQTVVDALLAGTLTIRGTSGLTSAAMKLLAQAPVVMSAIKAAYWLNFPNHRVWNNEMGQGQSGEGTGEPIFYDNPADETSNPNDRSVVTAFTYRKWPAPIRKGLEDRIKTAMLEAKVNPTASNAEFAALTAAWVDKSMINIG